MPVLGNLFGTPARVARAMGVSDLRELRLFGEALAALKEPEPPKGFKEMMGLGSLLKTLWNMAPREVSSAPCQEVVWEGADVDLARLPVQHCWPGDVAPLITWGLVITQGPQQGAAEPGHLPPAGALAQPGHHALARAPRRRAGLSRSLHRQSGPALSGGGGAGGRPGHAARRRDAGARQPVGVPVRRPAARVRGPKWCARSAAA